MPKANSDFSQFFKGWCIANEKAKPEELFTENQLSVNERWTCRLIIGGYAVSAAADNKTNAKHLAFEKLVRFLQSLSEESIKELPGADYTAIHLKLIELGKPIKPLNLFAFRKIDNSMDDLKLDALTI